MWADRLSPELRNSAPVFAALGDRTRLLLVARLSAGEPLSITQLASGTHVTRQAVTKHLHVMAEAGLVKGFRHGREQLWELNPQELRRARQCLERIASQWDGALTRLKALVEQGQMLR
jgi:DNA-binding transcriptional ArsR family regulator